MLTIGRRLFAARGAIARHFNRSARPAAEPLDPHGQPYNEMDALPFNRRPGVKEEPDWCRRLFVVGYMGGTAVFLYLVYYKPDVTLETWSWNAAQQRMQDRGVDMFWLDKAKFVK